jgi:hypothetical protein
MSGGVVDDRDRVGNLGDPGRPANPERLPGAARPQAVGEPLSLPSPLFLVSWVAQAFAEWGTYVQDQREHGGSTALADYLVQFGQSTLENWQSEFLQLFSFVVLSAVLIHKGSAESKDGDEEIRASLERIERRLDELDHVRSG